MLLFGYGEDEIALSTFFPQHLILLFIFQAESKIIPLFLILSRAEITIHTLSLSSMFWEGWERQTLMLFCRHLGMLSMLLLQGERLKEGLAL